MAVLESEVHFICECPLYNDLRHVINNKYIFPVKATMSDKFELIMSTNCRFLLTFICQAWDRRTDNMYSMWYVTYIISFCGIEVISVTMYRPSDRYDSFAPNVTDDYIWFERTQSSPPVVLDRCWASVMDSGPALVWRWMGAPCLLRGYPLYRLRRCPGTAPTLGRSWCLLWFTILCNNVTFWLSRSAYICFFTTNTLEWLIRPNGLGTIL